jgi:hypothetical protein
MVVLYQLTTFFYQVLSPLQRFHSMRRLQGDPITNIATSKWFLLSGLGLIGVLLIVLFVIRKMRLEKERLSLDAQFREMCEKCRLTSQEREILISLCRQAQVVNKNMIFMDHAAFESGFAGLMQDSFSAGHSLRQRKQLNVMVHCIKAKMGFQKGTPTNDGAVFAPRKMSSRQIPEGRNVRVEIVSESSVSCFEASVIRNDSFELVLQPQMAVEATPGHLAQVQYQVGAMTWIFESTIIACGSGGLELNHNEDVKFVNRRRFPRVPVRKNAKIAAFEINQALAGQLTAPVFEDATVMELSGPGLKIQTNMDLKALGRVLIIFEVQPGQVIQDVAEVRAVYPAPNGQLVGVEMIGLNENTVNELIQMTHKIARTSGSLPFEPQIEDASENSGYVELAGADRNQEQAV